MKSISITELKTLKVADLKALVPCEITADGEVIAELGVRGLLVTKCPNCHMVYNAKKPDDKPLFFSIQKKRPPQEE